MKKLIESESIDKFRLLATCLATGIVMIWCGAVPSQAGAELRLSGDLALTQRFLDQYTDINANFRGDDPFNTVRGRLFARNWLSEDVAVFTEFLFDTDAGPRMNGAYAVFNDVVKDLVNFKIGFIPSPFGNYGLRSTYFNLNPVIGVPLMWQYKTSMIHSATVVDRQGTLADANREILSRRTEISGSYVTGGKPGTPVAYDACWDTGIEVNGSTDRFEYAAALTNNSLSNPARASGNDGYQGILKLGASPVMGLRTGVSGAMGAYLTTISPSADSLWITEEEIDAIHNVESFHQRALGWYGEYLFGKFEIFSEWVYSEWDVPGLNEETLFAHSGYLDIRWNLLPSWYVAGRVDYMDFSEIENTWSESPLPREEKWDIPLMRIEPALAWRFRREGMVKLVYQGTYFDGDLLEDVHLLAVQLHMAF